MSLTELELQQMQEHLEKSLHQERQEKQERQAFKKKIDKLNKQAKLVKPIKKVVWNDVSVLKKDDFPSICDRMKGKTESFPSIHFMLILGRDTRHYAYIFSKNRFTTSVLSLPNKDKLALQTQEQFISGEQAYEAHFVIAENGVYGDDDTLMPELKKLESYKTMMDNSVNNIVLVDDLIVLENEYNIILQQNYKKEQRGQETQEEVRSK